MTPNSLQIDDVTSYAPVQKTEDKSEAPFALPANIRRFMEAMFGQDFSAVRIEISTLPGQYNATAFAQGHKIYFQPGYFAPDTSRGIRLLAHELAHIVQQAQGRTAAPVNAQNMVVSDLALELEADQAADYCVCSIFGQAGAPDAKMPERLMVACRISTEPVGPCQPIQCAAITAAQSYQAFKTSCWTYLSGFNGTAVGALNHQVHMNHIYQNIYSAYNGHNIAVPAKVALANQALYQEMIDIFSATKAVHNDNIIRIQHGRPWPQIAGDVAKNAIIAEYQAAITALNNVPPLALPAFSANATEATRRYLHIYTNPRRVVANNWRIGINIPPAEIAQAVAALMPVMQAQANINHIKFSAPTMVTKPDSVIVYLRRDPLNLAAYNTTQIAVLSALGAYAEAIAIATANPAAAADYAAAVAPAAATAAAANAASVAATAAAAAAHPVDPALNAAAAFATKVAADADVASAIAAAASAAAAAAAAPGNAGLAAAAAAAAHAVQTPVAAAVAAGAGFNIVHQFGPIWNELAEGLAVGAEPPNGGGSFGNFRSILAYQAYLLMRKQFCQIRWNAGNYGNTTDALYNHFGIPAAANPQDQNNLAQPFFTVRGMIFTGLKSIYDRGSLLTNR